MVKYTLYVGKAELKVMAKIQLQKQQKESRSIRQRRIVYVALALVNAAAAALLCDYPQAIAVFGVVAAACLYMAILGWKRQFLKNAEKQTRRALMQADDLPRAYIFSDEQIEIVTDWGKGNFQWSLFESFGRLTHYLYLFRNDGSLLLIDEKRLSEEERKELDRLLKKHQIRECGQ